MNLYVAQQPVDEERKIKPKTKGGAKQNKRINRKQILEEAGHQIALAISTQAILEARIKVEDTQQVLARMAAEGTS